MRQKAVKARVYGKVQGVFFRKSTLEQAIASDIQGWVRNVPDGTVEVHVQGEPEKVQELITWLHKGSEWSRVDQVITEDAELIETDRFYIQR